MRGRLLIAIAIAVWSGASAAGHHILGLPHYRYSKEYPQIPYVEVLAQVGGLDVRFTYYPGTPSPGERVRFKLYAKNVETGKPFRAPLAARIVRRRFVGASVPVGEPLTLRVWIGPEANDYKFFRAFRGAEAYEIQVRFPSPSGGDWVPFPVTIGKTDDRPLILGAVAVLGLAVVSARILKRKGSRRRHG